MGEHKPSLAERVAQHRWVHTIDLGNGVVTPGEWGMGNPAILQAMSEIDFKGKKVLDIGCWDGVYSFMAEKAGAKEVYATDLIDQRAYVLPTFNLAKEALNSNVKYFPHVSVYDVEQKLDVRDFDVVIYCGVYYHIKDPLRSFTALRRVMADGGVMLVEGAILDVPPAPAGSPPAADCFARYYYRDKYCGDDSNWWVPTVPCLKAWVESSYLEIAKEYGYSFLSTPNPRFTLTAKAVRRDDPVFIRPDPELSKYDLKTPQ
jgi:tRNA (mo5U34)-methyltransferase